MAWTWGRCSAAVNTRSKAPVDPRRPGIELLAVVAHPADQQRHAQRHEEVGQDGADDRGPDQLQQPGPERHRGDDELGEVAEGRVEEAADRGAGAFRDLLGALHDQAGGRDDREGRREKHQSRRGFRVFQKDARRHEEQQPVHRTPQEPGERRVKL